MHSKVFNISILLVSICLSIFLGVLTRNTIKQHGFIGVTEEKRHSISISGEGEVIGIPDIAQLQLGLVTEKSTIDAAQEENTKTMNAVIERLKKNLKIDEKDIQTANYNMNPRYDWIKGKRDLKGYTVSQNLNLKIRDLSGITEVLKLAGEYNLNQVNSLTFSIDDPEKLKQEARVLALKNAKLKAQNLADIMGVKLGKVLSFSESAGGSNYPVMRNFSMTDEAVGMGGGAPNIEAGSTNIIIYASVEYEIQ